MKLSIITINYNNKSGLEKTIDSVMSQTWRDFEWIFIDGCSTDGSAEVIAELAKSPDANISYWCSEKDKGVYNAMNKGIAKAKCQYVNFMNSGDCYVDNGVLEYVFKNTNHTEDVLYGDWIDVKEGKEIQKWSAGDDIDIIRLLRQCTCHQAMFFSSVILKERGYDESYKLMADWKLNLQLLSEGYSFGHLKRYIAFYDISGVSSCYNEAYYNERDRMRGEVFPKNVMDLIVKVRDNEDILGDSFACAVARHSKHHHRTYKYLIKFFSQIHFIRCKLKC